MPLPYSARPEVCVFFILHFSVFRIHFHAPLQMCIRDRFCVLTPEGTELSSEGLAERLQAEKLNGRSAACFLIGSSFGIDARIKRMADFRLSFSKMTFPHHLMRVMALEQLYRAESILAGTKYHK